MITEILVIIDIIIIINILVIIEIIKKTVIIVITVITVIPDCHATVGSDAACNISPLIKQESH